MSSAFRRSLILSVLAMGLLVAGGCSYRSDVTPELDSVAANSEQDYNRYARVIDNNTRSAWDDLASILLIDRNMRLTRAPRP